MEEPVNNYNNANAAVTSAASMASQQNAANQQNAAIFTAFVIATI